MPKMKTKSGAKKRFKITGTGKVMFAHQGKRHGMIKWTKKQIRQLRGTAVMFKTDGEKIKKFFLPLQRLIASGRPDGGLNRTPVLEIDGDQPWHALNAASLRTPNTRRF